jgi:hypothetical protein
MVTFSSSFAIIGGISFPVGDANLISLRAQPCLKWQFSLFKHTKLKVYKVKSQIMFHVFHAYRADFFIDPRPETEEAGERERDS